MLVVEHVDTIFGFGQSLFDTLCDLSTPTCCCHTEWEREKIMEKKKKKDDGGEDLSLPSAKQDRNAKERRNREM